MKNRIHIFTGHFGSGKTEVALNFALQEKKKGEDVVIVDLDIVNPYFRTNDARNVLMKNGIKVVANNYASSNVDMPTMPLDILSVFNNDNSVVVFDVGGDDDGALALGQYKQYFDKYGYEMHFIVNTKRPLTRTNDELIEIAERIESASRLKFTDIYNNTNLSDQTDETTLFSGYDEIKMLSKKMGIVIKKNCGIDKALSNVPTNLKDTEFRMNICILRPWEIQ